MRKSQRGKAARQYTTDYVGIPQVWASVTLATLFGPISIWDLYTKIEQYRLDAHITHVDVAKAIDDLRHVGIFVENAGKIDLLPSLTRYKTQFNSTLKEGLPKLRDDIAILLDNWASAGDSNS